MSIQKQMLRYLNIARQQPSYFSSLIQKQLGTFINDKQMPINDEIIYQTNQGKSVWKQTLAFLNKQQSLPPLTEHQGLANSSFDHAKDLAKNNIFGHTGSNGSNFSQRILKHCRKGQGSMAELIGADFYFPDRNHAEMTILGLIIDDGVPDRGHRKTIFSPSYRYLGCKSQSQGEKIITVFNLTENNLKLRDQSQSSTVSLNGSGYFPQQEMPKKSSRESNNPYKNQSKQNYGNQPQQFNNTAPSAKFSGSKLDQSRPNYSSPQSRFNSTLQGKLEPNSSSLYSPKRLSNELPSHLASKSKFHQQPQQNSLFNKSKNSDNDFVKDTNYNSNSNSNFKASNSNSLMNRKVKQKVQSSQVYYENNTKIIEVTTKLIYNDGTVEEKVDRNTIFLND